MLQLIGVLAFVVALLLSVMIHEFGHFLTAKKFGMKVTEFFLGFGTRLWSFQRGETEFGIKVIPAGGYCRIIGMSVHEELTPEEEPRAFIAASIPKRLMVLAAGSINHFILGTFLIFVMFLGIGSAAIIPSVGAVLPCIATTSEVSSTSTPCKIPSPARLAGLQANDQIISINGRKVTNWSKDVKQIQSSAGKVLTLVIKRGDKLLTINAAPSPVLVNGKTIGMLGIESKVGLVREPLASASEDTYHLTANLFSSSVTSLISLPSKVPALFRQTFLGAKRDPNGLVGVVGVAQASAQTVSDRSIGWNEKLQTFLLIIASLNIFVGIFNLLPLLPLDGGHMAVAILDGVRYWWAERKGRVRPAPFDLNRLTPVTLAVFALLVALSLMLLAADIFNPVHFNL